MSNRFRSDEELLARLVREAGDPSVSPDPQYAETLRATILDRVGPAETAAHPTEAVREADVRPASTFERIRRMKRIAKFAVAATVLVALGVFVAFTMIGGGSTSIAFADVADALDSLQSATYDYTSEMKNPIDGRTTIINAKGYFLAPSLERVELSMSTGPANDGVSSVMIRDCLAAKGITLLPAEKRAVTIDISMKEKSTGGTASMFETVRRLIREGSTGSGEEVESLGKKEIDGREVVGFRRRTNMGDVALWADPRTARLVRVETDFSGGGHGVLSNFRYDMELDPSLFSLEPPAGYTVQTQTVTMPVEADLVEVLRVVAENNDGIFPTAISMSNKEFMQAVQAEMIAESEKLLITPEAQKLMAKLVAEYGEDETAFRKAWMKEWMKMTGPITEKLARKQMQGVNFYLLLRPQNDSHYVGGGVKLGTPDRPILWYKPTGADKYRVIYADLSVKEASPAEIKDFPEAPEGYPSIGASFQGEKHLIEMLRVYAGQQNGLLPPTLTARDIESGTTAPFEEKIKAKYGSSREARMKAMQDGEFIKYMGLGMKCSRGLGFLHDLKPENDSHYAGKDVKLGTPDRPILWYKPAGAEKYRVIYADLSVRDMAPDDVKRLPEATPK